MRTALLTIHVLILLSVLAITVAHAEEQPCRYSADRSAVTCNTTGFKKLVDEAISARGDANTCAIRLNAADAALADTRQTLNACVAAVPPEPPTRPRWPSRVGYGLAVIGSAVTMTSALSSSDPLARGSVGLSGVLAMVTGYLLIDRE